MNKLFRILCALLAAALLLGTLPGALAAEAEPAELLLEFEDVRDPSRYYYTPVYWALRRGVTSGVTPERFKPNAVCTRAEIVTFLWRTVGSPELHGETGFDDVRPGAYYEKAVLWASRTGVTSGTDANSFSPDAVCTRAQALTFLHRAARCPQPKSAENPFKDVKADSFCAEAVRWAVERSVANGVSETRFQPNKSCTRGQVVSFLWRAVDDITALTPSQVASLLAKPASQYAQYVYSHQGTAKEEDAETIAAYDLVIRQGSRYIEQDLVISADGVLYCSHELSPVELTGEKRRFSQMSSAEIDALRTIKGGHRLMRLSDVFERYGKKLNYVIELKAGAPVVKPFLALVAQYGMEDNVIVQSSELKLLQQVEDSYPRMRKLFLVFDEQDYEDALASEIVDCICVGGDLFNEECCAQVQSAGKRYCVAVCNPDRLIVDAIKMGADCYFTDYTARAFELEERYRQ